jgi:hypothetical protein
LDDDGALIGVFPLLRVERRELRFVKVRELTSSGTRFKAGLPHSVQKGALTKLVEHAKDSALELGADRIVISYPAWLDVHKESVTACVLVNEGARGRKRKEEREFGMTRDLLELADRLRDRRVADVAMRRPVFTGSPSGTSWRGSLKWCWSTPGTSSEFQDGRPI